MLGWLLKSSECTVKVEKPPKGGYVYVVVGSSAAKKLVLDKTVHGDSVFVVVLCEKG